MKKLFVAMCFMLIGFNVFCRDNLLETYESSLELIYADEAERILMGDIDLIERYVSDLALAKLSSKDLRLLRNELFAIHGNIFNSQDLTDYFSLFSWYNPTSKVSESVFSEKEKKLLDRIKIFEACNENAKNIVLRNTDYGLWLDMPIVASDWSDRFVFYDETYVEYRFNEMKDLKIAKTLKGKYEIKGNVLFFYVKELEYRNFSTDIEHSEAFGYDDRNKSYNTIIYKNPILYKFPITKIEEKQFIPNNPEYKRKVMQIGSCEYFKIQDSVID